jgi:hypothetical protein
VSGGAIAYLKVEKPHFLFLEGSMGAMAVADAATVALPDASSTRATSFVDRPAAPQVLAPLPPLRLAVRGCRLPPLRGARPLSLSSSSSSSDDEYSDVAEGESPCC